MNGVSPALQHLLAAARELCASAVKAKPRAASTQPSGCFSVGAGNLKRLSMAVEAIDKLYHPTISVYVECEEDREELTPLLEERIPEVPLRVDVLPHNTPAASPNTVFADTHGHVAEALQARSDARKADNPKGYTPSSERGPGSDTYPKTTSPRHSLDENSVGAPPAAPAGAFSTGGQRLGSNGATYTPSTVLTVVDVKEPQYSFGPVATLTEEVGWITVERKIGTMPPAPGSKITVGEKGYTVVEREAVEDSAARSNPPLH